MNPHLLYFDTDTLNESNEPYEVEINFCDDVNGREKTGIFTQVPNSTLTCNLGEIIYFVEEIEYKAHIRHQYTHFIMETRTKQKFNIVVFNTFQALFCKLLETMLLLNASTRMGPELKQWLPTQREREKINDFQGADDLWKEINVVRESYNKHSTPINGTQGWNLQDSIRDLFKECNVESVQDLQDKIQNDKSFEETLYKKIQNIVEKEWTTDWKESADVKTKIVTEISKRIMHYIACPIKGADSNLVAWLKKIGIRESDVPTIMEQFSKYGVSTLAELFALDDGDVDEVLGNLPLAKRKLLKKAIAREK